MRNAQRGALRSFWAVIYKGDQSASSFAGEPAGIKKLAGEQAMRNAILCGSGFERASEATSSFRIIKDAGGHGRSQ